MQLGMIGLGRMGGNMVRRLHRARSRVRRLRSFAGRGGGLAREGATGDGVARRVRRALQRHAHVCLMVPAAVVDDSIAELAPLLAPGDAIIDGGNSHYHDDIARAAAARRRAACTTSTWARAAASGAWSAATA